MIQVNIAIQPHRLHVAEQIIEALNNNTVRPTCICVILQGCIATFDSIIPIKYIQHQTNKGASERFKFAGNAINLIIDDDFIPSNTYVETAIKGLRRNPKALCSFWGYKFVTEKNYQEGWANIESWYHLREDVRCIKLGLGLCIWDEREIPLSEFKFNYRNFNDIQVAIALNKKQIEMYCLAHPEDIALHIAGDEVQQGAIWKQELEDVHTKFLNDKHQELIRIFALN